MCFKHQVSILSRIYNLGIAPNMSPETLKNLTSFPNIFPSVRSEKPMVQWRVEPQPLIRKSMQSKSPIAQSFPGTSAAPE